MRNSHTAGIPDMSFYLGNVGGVGLARDWHNDGIDTIFIYRNAHFYLRNSNTIGFAGIVFDLGIPGDLPIAGNWDGLP